MSKETEKLKWATRFLFSTSAHMAGSLCFLYKTVHLHWRVFMRRGCVCLCVCISVAMSKRCHLFHIYTRPSTESILCERCSCLRGKRQIVLMGVWPPTPWSHLGRAAFTKCVNDMRAVHDVTELFWHRQTWSARTECCMWLCSDAAWLGTVKAPGGLTVRAFDCKWKYFSWPYTQHRWCYDSNCMSFWVCLKMCATAWSYQWNRCGFAETGGYISTLTNWNVS